MAIEPACSKATETTATELPPELTARAAQLKELRIAKYACQMILAKLEPLSDKRASVLRMEGRLTHGTITDRLRTRDRQPLAVKSGRYADSSIPEGVTANGSVNGSHAPSKGLSLYYHYRWRMDKALVGEDVGKAYRLVGEATRDYEEHVGIRRSIRFEDGPDENGKPTSAHTQAVSHLLREFVGVPAEKVAIEMRTPSESFRNALRWVHRQRAQNGCDPELGEPRQSDARTQKVLSMAAAGLKQRMIAEELGISQPRVSQILANK